MKTTIKPAPYVPETYCGSWQPEIIDAIEHLRATCRNTVAERDMLCGLGEGEPLLHILNAVFRMAKAYQSRFNQPIGDDYMAAPEISGILSGVRGMLNFDGAAAWERQARNAECQGDSKDNGTLESLYWTACEIAGIDGKLDLNH